MKGGQVQFLVAVIATFLVGCATTPDTTPTTAVEDATPSRQVDVAPGGAPLDVPADTLEGAEPATVYFVNSLDVFAGVGQQSRKVPVYVDGEPLGLLPHKSFTVSQLEPGFHDIYPDQWIYFEPGRTYLLKTTGGFYEWMFDDPGKLAGMGCAEATLTDADRADLLGKGWLRNYASRSKKSWKRHVKFMEKAGVSPPGELFPMTVKAARCRGGPGDKGYGNQLVGGKVIIDETGIQCRSGNDVLTIPAEAILRIGYNRYFGFPYLEIDYGDPENPYHAELAGLLVREDLEMFTFRQRHYASEHYNLIFQAIGKSVELSRDRTDDAAAFIPPG